MRQGWIKGSTKGGCAEAGCGRTERLVKGLRREKKRANVGGYVVDAAWGGIRCGRGTGIRPLFWVTNGSGLQLRLFVENGG